MKRRVLFSESDSDDEKSSPLKCTSRPSKTRKLKSESKFDSEIFDDEHSSRRPVQLSIIESLQRQKQTLENTSNVKKPNTLDKYFVSKTSGTSKKEINVDDFFKNSVKKVSVLKTPPHSPPDIIPDTPILSSKSPLKVEKSHTTEKLQDSKTTPKQKNNNTNLESPIKEKHNNHSPLPSESTPKDRKSFWAYKARDGPQKLGSRTIPKAIPNCLKNLNFIITGVLECIERDDACSLIQNCGGNVLKTLGKKTNYLIVGREPGQSKLAKAETLNIKQINEDEFFQMIENYSINEPIKENIPTNLKLSKSPIKTNLKIDKSSVQLSNKELNTEIQNTINSSTKSCSLTARPVLNINTNLTVSQKQSNHQLKQQIKSSVVNKSETLSLDKSSSFSSIKTELWVDKYRPTSFRNLIGQNGPHSPANRLCTWLSAWFTNFTAGHKTKAYSSMSGWGNGGSNDDGRWARAALLSGPPGIGKTTTAHLVCNELGFSLCELNASVTRSKRSLNDEIRQSLGMQSLAFFATGQDLKLNSTKHVLIMDEVDGMAGNEDRGGIQELINMIKVSQIPIICMCNDRQSIKIRSLANYCLDLRFQRPRVEQIKSAILSIACKENINLPNNVITDIIQATNQDVRQVINNVQMWCSSGSVSNDQLITDAAGARKDLRLSAFDVIRKVFSPDISGLNGGPATFNESLDLFFQDYSLVPLFVQENYLNVKIRDTQNPKQVLGLLSQCAHDISTGDIVSKKIRASGTGSWSLLPIQGVFSVLRPGRVVRGSLPGGPAGVSFPSWFGKNSNQARLSRIATELSCHLRLSTHNGSANPLSLLLDYITPLSEALTRPLKEGDVDSTLDLLVKYQLTRDDLDSIMELTTWSSRPNRMTGVDTKVKSALTRTFNKSTHLLPYTNSSVTITHQKRTISTIDEYNFEDDVDGLYDTNQNSDEPENNEDMDLKNDAMIVVKPQSACSSKKRSKQEKSESNDCSSTSNKKRSISNTNRGGKSRGRGGKS